MKAALRRHWIAKFIRDTGVREEAATIAFETWWRGSAMSWMANLTGAVLVSTAVALSTWGQTKQLLTYQHSRVPIMDARAKATAHNQRIILDNQVAECAKLGVSCSADWLDAPER